MPPPDVSVIIPACAAETTLRRAVGSALESRGVGVQVVVVANDEADYEAALDLSATEAANVTFARTPAPRSGPSAARNLGVERADASLLAFLDADDFYAKDRLARLIPLARDHGAATGPCVPVPEDVADQRRAAPETGAVDRLNLDTIISSRRSFSPVLRRELFGPWRSIGFAEDMIFNAELHERAPDYAYDPAAVYGYVQTAQSGSRGPGSLQRALRGYGDILGQLFALDLGDEARAMLFRQLVRDLDEAGSALFAENARGWGEAVGGERSTRRE